MDFTSDLVSGIELSKLDGGDSGTHSNSSIIGNEQSNFELLDANERQKLKLQDEKEALLRERNLLLEEIAKYKESDLVDENAGEADKETSKADEINANIRATLDSNGIALFKDILSIVKDPTSSNVRSSKYDTLPILTLQSRIQYMKKYTFPYMTLSINSGEESTESENEGSITCEFKFTRNKDTNFSIELQVNYKLSALTISDYHITNISPDLKRNIGPLLEESPPLNANLIIFSCYEFDRLYFKRLGVFDYLSSEFDYLTTSRRDPNHPELLVLRGDAIVNDHTFDVEVVVQFKIIFSSGNKVPRDPRPLSSIHVQVKKDGFQSSAENESLNYICRTVTKRSGVKSGLLEACRLVFHPL
ncbi:hypothetical protein NCAS_0J00510 [Naumovozyma castellii]|uniref:Uncharacterized protein n=1 Tax=Naumovozyma castellii TaxID=27288 RepID=G0VKJ4_NAUCA|nr:hypothetical protein NCAS_0J00510 [Naumovozyma castellii CBS 4309]CCC72030.1 hypothetical protein NCAS_0J00510 [Naumovozyma castellii CBS 4309]